MVTLDDYRAIVDDRPKKFAPEDVNFHKAQKNEPPCAACIHFYTGVAMEARVCEILRTDQEDIPWDFTCMFNTRDGNHFPLYKQPMKEPSPDELP